MTQTYADGAPSWVDLTAPDIPAAADFYRGLFDWDAEDLGEQAGHYTMLSYQGKQIGAIGPCEAEAHPSWMVYFQVSDIRETAKAVEAAGGQVRMEPMDVFDQTSIAQFSDPAAAMFAAQQPRAHKGSEIWGATGSVGWTELHLTSKEPALGFYRDVFGWDIRLEQMGEQEYPLLHTAGATKSFGGIYLMDDEMAARTPPHWLLYFQVDDCDASVERATRLGASVLAPAMTVDQAGRFAVLCDINGASFAVIAER
jgi:predicted enzyme related to lactoylglutathione lyase